MVTMEKVLVNVADITHGKIMHILWIGLNELFFLWN